MAGSAPRKISRTRKPSRQVVGKLISEELYGMFREATVRLFPDDDGVDLEFALGDESPLDLVPDDLFSMAELANADFTFNSVAQDSTEHAGSFWETAAAPAGPEKTYRLVEPSVAYEQVEQLFGPFHSDALIRKLWQIDDTRASCGLEIRSVLGTVSLVLDNGSVVDLEVQIAARTSELATYGTPAWLRQHQRFAGELLLEHDITLVQSPQPTVAEIHSHGTLGAWLTERLRSRVTSLSSRPYLDVQGVLTVMPPIDEFLARASIEPQMRTLLRQSDGRTIAEIAQGVPEEAGLWGLLVAAVTAGAVVVDPVQNTTEFAEVAEPIRDLLDQLHAKIGQPNDHWFGVGEGATLRELRRAFDEERIRVVSIQLPENETILSERRQRILRALESAYDSLRAEIMARA